MKNNEIHALTGLRAVAALWVFVYHSFLFAGRVGSDARDPMALLGGAGFLGVDIFFVLSGFVLAHQYATAALHADLRRYLVFLWKRLARIYPVHLWALALVLVLQAGFSLAGGRFLAPSRLTLEGLLASLTLTHAWSIPVERTWNAVSWSISSEWAAYLAFPAVALVAGHVRSRWLPVVLLLAIYAALALAVAQGAYSGTMAYGMHRIAAGFTAGVLLHRLWTLRGRERGASFDRLAVAGLLAMGVAGNLLAIRSGAQAPLALMPILACVVVYGLAAGSGGASRILATPLALWGGRISYSFYMVHSAILTAFTRALQGTGYLDGAPACLAALVVIFAVAVGFGDLTYRTCEVPARRRMLALLGQRPADRTARPVAGEPAGSGP